MGRTRYHFLIVVTAVLSSVFLLLALIAVSMVTVRLRGAQSGPVPRPSTVRAAPSPVPFPVIPTITTAPATATPFSLLDTLPRRTPQPEPYPGFADDMYEDYMRDQAEQDMIDRRADEFDYGPEYEYSDFDEDAADAAEGAADDQLDDWMSGQ